MSDLPCVTVKQLAYQIRGFSEKPTPRFALFLGAGASIQSGIPTASGMILDFKRRIAEAECPDNCKTDEEKEKWLTAQPWYDEKNLYSALFEHYLSKEMGRQQYIETLIKRAHLSFGYVVLASLIASNYVKTVITTNFDDLVYTACTTYTGVRPVVYSYGLLAPELRFTSDNPKILKLHGDYLYSSLKNTKEELKSQDPNMAQQVIQTLNEYGLIVIGYSGGDESVMEILRGISTKNDLYWCIRRGTKPNAPVTQLLTDKHGLLVETGGFDQMLDEVRGIVGFNTEAMLGSMQQRQDELIKQIMTYAPNHKITNVLDEITSALEKQNSERQIQANKYCAFKLFAQALEVEDVGKPSDAENLYKKAIELKPDFANAYNNLGVLLAEDVTRITEAEAAYRKAIELEPDDASAYNNLGILLGKDATRTTQAEAALRKAIELKPDAAAYNNLGILLDKDATRTIEAEVAYRKAIELKPDYANAYNNLGILLDKDATRTIEAEVAYRKAIELKPDYANAYNNLGNLLAKDATRTAEAEAAYRKAIELKPDYANAYNNLGILLAKDATRTTEAEAAYRKAIELKPDYANAYNNLGNLLAKDATRTAEAEAAYRKAIELKPDYANAYNNLGNLLAKDATRTAEAEAALRKAIELNPKNAYFYYSLGELFYDQDKYDDVIAQFEHAVVLAPNEASFRNSLGWGFIVSGDINKATEELDKAIELDANYYPAFFNLGVAQFLQRCINEAKVSWQNAMCLYEHEEPNMLNHALLLIVAGEADHALKEMSSGLKQGVSHREVHYSLIIAQVLARSKHEIAGLDELLDMLRDQWDKP